MSICLTFVYRVSETDSSLQGVKISGETPFHAISEFHQSHPEATLIGITNSEDPVDAIVDSLNKMLGLRKTVH